MAIPPNVKKKVTKAAVATGTCVVLAALAKLFGLF